MTCRLFKKIEMKSNLRKLYTAFFCIYLIAVGLLCFLRPSSLPEVDIKTFLGIPVDKLLHFLMFLPYPILSGLVFIRKEQKMAVSIAILITLAVLGIGISYGTELIQARTGYRSYEIGDFYADITGIATGFIISTIYLTYIKLKK